MPFVYSTATGSLKEGILCLAGFVLRARSSTMQYNNTVFELTHLTEPILQYPVASWNNLVPSD